MMDSRIHSRQQAYSTRIGKSNGLASPVFKSRVVGKPSMCRASFRDGFQMDGIGVNQDLNLSRVAGNAPQEEVTVRDDRYKLGALITK
jgi:hypothetical protein